MSATYVQQYLDSIVQSSYSDGEIKAALDFETQRKQGFIIGGAASLAFIPFIGAASMIYGLSIPTQHLKQLYNQATTAFAELMQERFHRYNELAEFSYNTLSGNNQIYTEMQEIIAKRKPHYLITTSIHARKIELQSFTEKKEAEFIAQFQEHYNPTQELFENIVHAPKKQLEYIPGVTLC